MNCDYDNAVGLLAICEAQGLSISEIALGREAAEQGLEPESLLERMRQHYGTMKESIRHGMEIEGISPSGLSGGDARKLIEYSHSDHPLFGARFARTIAYGFAVHSFLAATMALAGARCVIPLDDVVIAMRDIGRRMPRALKETSEAGLATTPSGLRFKAEPGGK